MTDRPIAPLLSTSEDLFLDSGEAGGSPARIAALASAVPRDRVTVPISPVSPPDDGRLFDDPADASVKYWLPRYRLAEQLVSGQPRYRLGFAERDATWRLELGLVAVPPPGLEEEARSHPRLEHELGLELTYRVLGAPMAQKSVVFQELVASEDALDAALVLSSLSQRDEVFQALRDPARGAALMVRRRAVIAVEDRAAVRGARAVGATMQPINRIPLHQIQPIRPDRPIAVRPDRPVVVRPDRPIIVRPPVPPPRQPTPPPVPQLSFVGSERYTVRENTFHRFRLSVDNWRDFSTEHFEASPNLPPCGANTNASRCWVDIVDAGTNARIYGFCALGQPENLTKLWFARPEGTAPPATVKIRINDRLVNVTRESNSVATRPAAPPPPPEPQFIQAEVSIDRQADPSPFAFSPDLHGYVFEGIGGGTGPMPEGGLLRHRESFGGAVHAYFQDSAEPERIYHLPDDFRIARRGGDFRPPFITLRVNTVGGSVDNASATIDYVVAPVTQPARLASARTKLAARTRQPAEALMFQPLVAPGVRFFVQRPTATGRADEERPGGALMLQGATFDSVTMPLPEFQMAFDAMLGRTASRFGGRVEIDIAGWDTEIRPFVADAAAFAGPVIEVAAEESDGSLSLVARNTAESPVELENPAFDLLRAGAVTRVSVGETRVIGPGEDTVFETALPELPGSGPIDAELAEGARVRPDDAALLDAILDRSTLEYFRMITVETVASAFEPLPDRPDDRIDRIYVEFEGGDTVKLNAEALHGTARVDFPFDDVILRDMVATHYLYRRTIIRADGRQERDEEPLRSEASILFVEFVR